MNAVILRIATRYISPALLLISVLLLWRGHNLPGGGFIGGLLAAAAFLLLVLGRGWTRTAQLLPVGPIQFIGLGLMLAVSASLVGPIAGGIFFEGLWLPAFELPLMGEIKLGTPLVFDVGVYLTVFGFVLQSATALGREEDF